MVDLWRSGRNGGVERELEGEEREIDPVGRATTSTTS
jgi:hypothetical protein